MKDINTTPKFTSTRNQAKWLYWQGWRVIRIAEYLGEKAATVHTWKDRDKWDDASPLERCEGATEARYVQLVTKKIIDPSDIKAIDLLGRQMERFAKIKMYEQTGKDSDLNPNIRKRNEAPRANKNDIGEEGLEKLQEAFQKMMLEYQRTWYKAKKHRIRNILKSRQIGATYYFALEAIVDAFETGKNKIFLSASKKQAQVFKNYIVKFVQDVCDVQLQGDPLILPNGAEMHFLGTNYRTAQSYHGDIYMDEYFWIYGFELFKKVASGMALHKQWTQTYISTPSAVTHEAYGFWTGKAASKRRKTKDVKIDVSHAALKNGRLCEDGQWRQMVTIEDAMAKGADIFFNLEEVLDEYTDDEAQNLLYCKFIDDTHSVFPFAKMQACLVDAWEVWNDFKPFAPKPFGEKEVWVALDPDGGGEDGDGAGLIVLAPAKNGKKFRILEHQRMKGYDFEQQAEEVRKLTEKYKVTKIDVDGSTIGNAVSVLIAKFFPAVKVHVFSMESKAMLVLKGQHVIDRKRLEYDTGDVEITQAFISIRRGLTAGRQITYISGRSKSSGHADLAWATLMALSNESLEGDKSTSTSQNIVEISK